MPKYDQLTRDYAAWLFPLIDKRDCGEWVEQYGCPLPHNTSAELNNWSAGKYPPRSVTKSHIAAHLAGYSTCYYRSARGSGYALLMVDIDAHHGETDARAAADWLIANYLPGAYSEPSTGGMGVHIYLQYKLARVSRVDVNGYLADVGKALAALVAAEGYQSNVCGICGTFTTLDPDTKKIASRGQLGKMPRLPMGRISLDSLLSAPVYVSLRHVIDAAAALSSMPGLSDKAAFDAKNGCPTNMLLAPLCPPESEPKGGPARRAKLARQMYLLINAVTVDQLVSAYEVETPGNNGADKVRKDFERILQTFTFKGYAYAFDPKAVLPACKLIPASAYAWDRREVVNAERLADFVAVKLQDAFYSKQQDRYFARASRNATVANFRALKAKGMVDWICSQHQYTKLLKIAEDYGLLEVYDGYSAPTTVADDWSIVTGKGKARLIGPGKGLPDVLAKWLPLYQAWLARQDRDDQRQQA